MLAFTHLIFTSPVLCAERTGTVVDTNPADKRAALYPDPGPTFLLTKQRGGIEMADDRKQNLGQQRGMHEDQQGVSHQSPGRNPQDDRSAGGRGDQRGDQDRERRSGFDPSRGGDGGSYKEGGQNEHTRR